MSSLLSLTANVFQFANQYFYDEKVGTYLIDLSELILLFDLPFYTTDLKNELLPIIKGKKFIAVLSHGSCGIADGTKWQKELNLQVYLHKNDKYHPWLRMQPDVLFDQIPQLHGDVEIIFTPGHSPGSVCLLHKPSNSLFSGDSIYSKNGKLTLDDNHELRREGMRKLMNYQFENIFPFHYQSFSGGAKEALASFLA